jgi:threonine aldolase
MQLASKMRYLSAQFLAFLEGDLWKRSATQANAMARRLEAAIRDRVEIPHPVEANAVFAVLPAKAAARLLEDFHFYPWEKERSLYRLMCSFQTTAAEIDAFAAALERCL